MKRKATRGRNDAHSDEAEQMVAGVAWYRPEEWAKMKASASDADLLENSFAEWEKMATESLPLLQWRFQKIVKVYIVADEFLMWCQLRGKANDAEARAEFAAEKVQAGNTAAS